MAPKKTNIDPSSAPDANVTRQERKVLEDIDYRKAESEDQPLIEGQLGNTDDDGDPLNEDDDLSGEDLDVPGAEDDDLNEEIGEEDEENNEYSLDDNDDEENEL